ncbi:MAG: hypothetical protein ACKOOL_08270 [Novosphingobium sp.]
MTDYRKRFDERLPALEAAIRDMPGSLDDLVPGLTKERVVKIFRRISVLLGRLDSKGAKHPQYLWINGVTSPESMIGQIDSIIANSATGASSFVQNHLPSVMTIADSLEKSIGTDASEMRSMLSSVNSDLSIAVSQTDELSAQAEQNVSSLGRSKESAETALKSIVQLLESIREDASKANTIRRSLETLTSPDGRNKNSLESLARRARERIAELEQIYKNANDELDNAKAKAIEVSTQKGAADEIMLDLRGKRDEASQILNLSSQAGLAASYQAEKKNLGTRHLAYSGILYASAFAAFIVAICYVIPSLENTLRETSTAGEHGDFWKALSFTVLRASVIAPLVYVIYFTQKTLYSIDLLRMDYAEKSAASLAYSGYKEQMEADPELVKQLQASLLIKFAEHPERLLLSGGYSSKAKVKTTGFEAEVETKSEGKPDKVGSDEG